jgi:hypothetical protein
MTNRSESVPDRTSELHQGCGEQLGQDVYCPDCGYNLRALISDRCPECGLDVSFVKSDESRLPWLRRDTLGILRAYLMTVWMVMFRTKHFCLEMSRPVDEVEARRFRCVTIVLAFTPFLLFTAALKCLRPDCFDAFAGFGGYTFVVVTHAAIMAAWVSMTGVPYYVIRHPDIDSEKQMRAAALSLYCGAPLCLMGVAVATAIAGVACSRMSNRNWDLLFYTLGGGVFLILMVVFLFDMQRVIRWMLGSSERSWAINLKLFFFWFLTGFLSLVGLPSATVFVMIVWHSMM